VLLSLFTVAVSKQNCDPRADFMLPFSPLADGFTSSTVPGPLFHDRFYHVSQLLLSPEQWMWISHGADYDFLVQLDPALQARNASFLDPSTFTPLAPATVLTLRPSNKAGGFLPNTPVAASQVFWLLIGYPQTLPAFGTNSSGPYFSYTMLDHFADSFKFQRGGLRLKAPFEAGQTKVPGAQPQITISVPRNSLPLDGIWNIPGNVTYGPPVLPLAATFNTAGNDITCGSQQLPLALEMASGCNSLCVEVPYRSDALYFGTGSSYVSGVICNTARLTGDNSTPVRVSSRSAATSDASNAPVWYRSAADDFRFAFIKCLKPSVEIFSTRTVRASARDGLGVYQYTIPAAVAENTAAIVYY